MLIRPSGVMPSILSFNNIYNDVFVIKIIIIIVFKGTKLLHSFASARVNEKE
jgi:hypothetical protein